MKRLGLYIHFPFCIKKCGYCDFCSISTDDDEKRRYISALKREIEQIDENIKKEYVVYTIYLGGGTPTILEPNLIEEVLHTVIENFTIHRGSGYPEITIECNPKTVDRAKLISYKKNGINRISIGLQSFLDSELRILGRANTVVDFLKSYELVTAEGFENVSLDIMYGLPKQSTSDYKKTLEKVLKLKPAPKHISSYSLIIEPDTAFFKKYSENSSNRGDLPSDEIDRKMYRLTKEMLENEGFIRYEISNYSKYSYQSRHNLAYWDRVDYIGIGVSAASLIDGKRYTNIRNIKEYIKKIEANENIREEFVNLTVEEEISETMFLGLRKIEGVDKLKFRERFNKNIEDVYRNVIEKNVKKALLIDEPERIRLSELGLDVSNYVMSDFILYK